MAVLFDTRLFHRALTETALQGGVATKQDILVLRQNLELVTRDLKLWFGSGLVVVAGVILGAAKLIWG